MSWLGSRAPSKAPWHVSRVLAWLTGEHHARPRPTLAWLARHQARPRGTLAWLAGGHHARPRAILAWLAGGHHARPRATLAWLAGTKQGPVAPWLGSRAGTMQGPVAPWLGSRAGTTQGPVAPWLGSWAGTMQGPVPPCLSSRAGIMQGPVVHLACLGSACGHHARPRGTRHGMGGGTCHVSLVKRPSFYAFAKFLRDDMTWARGWGGSRPAEASKGRGDIAGASRGWFQTSGPGPGKVEKGECVNGRGGEGRIGAT